jgi:hypothetical protein
VRQTRPDAVVLWAQRKETARPDVPRVLRRYPVRPVVAGPGWGTARFPVVARVTSLGEALAVLTGDPRP